MAKSQADREAMLRIAVLGTIANDSDLTRAKLAHRLNMDESTLTRRLQRPSTFSQDELRAVFKELGFIGKVIRPVYLEVF